MIRGLSCFVLTVVMIGVRAAPVDAQQPVEDVLSFLLTNRSIPTGDFVRDALAAQATREAISQFLLVELGSAPVSSASGGFTYRLNPTLGSNVRSSDSFGLFLLERSLTSGRRHLSVGLAYQRTTYVAMDGRELRDGTLVATASRFRGDIEPFDVETLTLRLRTENAALLANYGVTDRLDVGAVVPLIKLSLGGQRVDVYRGQSLVQATASASASGLGDVVVRAKYNVVRLDGRGVSVGAETRVPTGDEQNLLGAGRAIVKPQIIVSSEAGRVGLHGDLAYCFGCISREINFGGGLAYVIAPRVTMAGELIGRRLAFGRLSEVTESHPQLAGVETVRLTSVRDLSTQLTAVTGIKWNVAGTVLLGGHVRWPLTTTGLSARWLAMLTLDYAMGR